MLKVSLTGGFGAGKTTVAKIFMSLGVPVFFSDEVSKKLQNSDNWLINTLKKNFGKNIYDKNDKLQTFTLASIVFNNHIELEKLNSIMHPLVIKKFSEWLLEQHSNYIIKETALPYVENQYLIKSDINILVKVEKHIRIKRIMDRNKMTYLEVTKRIDSQINFEYYAKFADFIIYNEGQELIPQVIDIHNKIENIYNK